MAEGADQAVHVAQRALPTPNGKQHRFVEQLAEIDFIVEADQLQVQLVGCTYRFVEFERNHFEFTLTSQRLEGEVKVGLAGHADSLESQAASAKGMGHPRDQT
ncbi:hypothetical protein D3C79_855530 [compost metagenome]